MRNSTIPGALFDAIFEQLGIERRDTGRVVLEPSGILSVQHFLRNEEGKFYPVNLKTGKPIKPGEYKTFHRDEHGELVSDYELAAAQETILARIIWDKSGA